MDILRALINFPANILISRHIGWKIYKDHYIVTVYHNVVGLSVEVRLLYNQAKPYEYHMYYNWDNEWATYRELKKEIKKGIKYMSRYNNPLYDSLNML